MWQSQQIFFRSSAIAIFALCIVASAQLLPAQVSPDASSALVVARQAGTFLTLDPEHSQLHWNVDSTLHMVHGTFALKSGAVHFNPETGQADGQIVVSAPSGESGNASRDKRKHRE